MKRIISIIVILYFGIISFAQTQEQLKKANQLLYEAKISEATIAWKTILAENPRNASFNFNLGLCYYKSFDKGYLALEYFKKAVRNISDSFDFNNLNEITAPTDALFFLGEAYLLNNKPDSALSNYIAYLRKAGENKTLPVEQRINDCLNAIGSMKLTFKTQKLTNLVIINSPFAETNPIVSWDESTMYFASRKVSASSSDKEPESFLSEQKVWVSYLKDNKWGQPEQIGIVLEGTSIPLFISKDGNKLFFSQKNEKDWNIYSTEYQNNKWNDPVKLSFNSSSDETGFTMSLDEKTAWFSSNKKGGKGGFDIYRIIYNENIWGVPVNVSELNTSADEVNPFVNPDGKILFFSSNGFPEKRIGGFDIYISKIFSSGRWEQPANLGSPINTSADNLFFSRSASDNIAYISRIEKERSYELLQVNGFNINDYNLSDLSITEIQSDANQDITDPSIREAIKKLNSEGANQASINLLEKLEPSELALVLNSVDIEKDVKVVEAMEPSKAAAVMDLMDVEKAIEITQNLPLERSVSVLHLMNLEKSITVLEGIEPVKASMITGNMEISKAVKVMEGLSPNLSSAIINNMEISKAVEVIDGIDPNKASGILEGVEIEKAVGVIDKLSKEKSNNIVSGLESERASAVMGSINIEKAVDIMESLPSEKAADVMENLDLSKSVAVVNAMDNQKAAGLIDKMDLTKAVAVMEGIPKENAVYYIQGMEIEKAVGVIKGLNSEKGNLIVEDLLKKVNNDVNNKKVVEILKKYFAGQISNKESIIFKTIYFEFNSSELLLLSRNELLMLVDFLQENKLVKIEVVGHTDNIGDWDVNLKVSGERAKVVYDFLRTKNIEHDRIIFYGKGPASPITTNETDYGRKLNRRVEVILLQ